MGSHLCCIRTNNNFKESIASKNTYKSTQNTSFSILSNSIISKQSKLSYLEQASQLFLKQQIDIDIDINSEIDGEELETISELNSYDSDFKNLF